MELNQFRPPTSSDDLCILFCMLLILMSQVSVELEHLGLVAVGQPAEFTIRVPEGADAELAVSVQGPVEDIPVKVTGDTDIPLNVVVT